jgi:hyperosmotically inducible protein
MKGSLLAVRSTAVALALALVGPAASVANWRPDAWITTKAKIALATTEDVSAIDVNVDTVNGRVTLHGKVPTETAKARAAEVTDDIEGVTKVVNLLQVVPAAERKSVERSDSDIEAAVSQALADDPNLKGSDIEVQSVNDGVVLLSGESDSLFDHLAAIRRANSVPGVRRVASEVKTDDELYDEDELAAYSGDVESEAEGAADKMKEGAKQAMEETKDGANYAWQKTKDAAQATGDAAKGAANETSNSLRDAWITTATKSKLIADPDTPALDINVDTRDGEVTLFGVVASKEAKRQAEEKARQVSGVEAVHNDLVVNASIVTASGAERVARTDETVKQNVESALEMRQQLREADIDVGVASGTVRLTGSVPNQALRESAGTIARSVDGVKSVKNELRVDAEKHAAIR